MRRDESGKRIKTEIVGARVNKLWVDFVKDNLRIFGCNDMTEYLNKKYHDDYKFHKESDIAAIKERIEGKKANINQETIEVKSLEEELEELIKKRTEFEKTEEASQMAIYTQPRRTLLEISMESITDRLKKLNSPEAEELIKNLITNVNDCFCDEDVVKMENVRQKLLEIAKSKEAPELFNEGKISFYDYIYTLKSGKSA
jgi:chromosome segregation ATPase